MTQARPHSDSVRVIDDLDTLRLLTQPVRLKIVEALRSAPGPLTVKELAATLGTPQTKLYYHVNLLEGADLIRVAATRLVSGIVEKRYAAASYRIGVDRALLSPAASGDDGLEVLLSIMFDQVRTEIRRSVAAGLIDLDRSRDDDKGPNSLVLGRKWLLMRPEETAEFLDRLDQVQHDYQGQDPMPSEFLSDAPPGSQLYELLLGFYPAVIDVPGESQAAMPSATIQTAPNERHLHASAPAGLCPADRQHHLTDREQPHRRGAALVRARNDGERGPGRVRGIRAALAGVCRGRVGWVVGRQVRLQADERGLRPGQRGGDRGDPAAVPHDRVALLATSGAGVPRRVTRYPRPDRAPRRPPGTGEAGRCPAGQDQCLV